MEEKTYLELIMQIPTTKEGKESRELHKKIRKLGKGGGVNFHKRYPNFTFYLSLIAFAVSIITTIKEIFF